MSMKSNPTKTALTIVTGLVLVYLKWPHDWVLMIALFIGLAGVFSPYLSEKTEFAWMKLAWALGFIVPNILLTGIFYLFLLPFALLSRIFGTKDPMNLRPSEDSMFKDTNKSFDKKTFENPW